MLEPEICGTSRGQKNVDKNICIKRYEEFKEYWFINPGACQGDSGGPGQQYYDCQAIQLGVISADPISGMATATCMDFSWLTRVSLYVDWIRSVIYPEAVAAHQSKTGVGVKASRLLIISVITATIIAVLISSALLWRKSYIKF